MAPLKLSFRVSGMTRDVPSPAKQRGGGGLAAGSLAWSRPCLDVSRWGWSAGPPWPSLPAGYGLFSCFALSRVFAQTGVCRVKTQRGL